jgi:hypothetical protein
VIGLNYLIEKNIAKQIISFIAKEDDDAGGLLRDKCLSWALSISRNPNTQLILLDSLPLVESLDSYFLNGNPVCLIFNILYDEAYCIRRMSYIQYIV